MNCYFSSEKFTDPTDPYTILEPQHQEMSELPDRHFQTKCALICLGGDRVLHTSKKSIPFIRHMNIPTIKSKIQKELKKSLWHWNSCGLAVFNYHVYTVNLRTQHCYFVNDEIRQLPDSFLE